MYLVTKGRVPDSESRCSSLEMIVGLETNSRIFTVSVQGLLELQVSHRPMAMAMAAFWDPPASPPPVSPLTPQAGQYTSIFVDNAAGAPITIQNGSDFMGMLLGV